MAESRTTQEAAAKEGSQALSVEASVRNFFAPAGASPEEARLLRRLASRWRATLRRLRPLGEVSSGNTIRVLAEGDAAFESIWEAIGRARRRVVMDTYILENDRVGRRPVAELEAAAARGAEVLLVYDALGSGDLDDDFTEALTKAGGRVFVFNPVWSVHRRLPRFVRNHRKILVVDGERAFCGGMNIGEEYAGAVHGTNLFRDTHLLVEGPAAADLEDLVRTGVEDQGGGTVSPSSPGPSDPTGVLVQILESNVGRQRRAIQKALRLTLDRAVDHCQLTSPYFVPPKRLLSSLERAAKRGVDVRVLTAGTSDVPIVRVASHHLYSRLLRAGVRIFELQGRTLHAKVVTADGIYASVGSFNLDSWSWRRNLEVTVAMLDREVTGTLEEQFEADLEDSREILPERWSRRGWFARVWSWLAYNLMRF